MVLIDRPAVSNRLRKAVDEHAITILSAALGTGKSSALAVAFANDPSFTTLEIERRHRGSVVAALVETVRAVRVEFGRLTLGAFESGAPSDHVGHVFARELRHVRAPLVIALDNAHLLDGDDAALGFFGAALADLPQPVRLLLVGRTVPALDLSDAFARQRATTIAREALRFTSDDIAALARNLGHDLERKTIEATERATAGWATGIVLALTTPDAGFADFASIDAAAHYLDAHLIPTLAPDVVAFLESTAVFETLDLTLLERTPAFARARELVADLVRAGALVTPLGRGTTYRVHPILRDLARRRLASRGAVAAAHAAAVDVYVRAGAFAAALYHAHASDDVDLAGRFLRAHATAAIATGDRARVRAIAGRIDPDGVDADVAAFVRGLDEKAGGSPHARISFECATRAAADSGDAEIAFFARMQTIEYDLGRLRHVDADELAGVRERAPSFGPLAVATADVLAGWAEAIAFDFRAARDRIAPMTTHGDGAARFTTGILHAYAQTALGEFDSAQRSLDALLAFLENDDRTVLQTLALVWFARLALAWGATNAAADAAAQAERLAGALDFHAEEAALFGALTELATHRGDATAALAFAERAHDRAGSAWYVADIARVRAFSTIATARAAFIGHDNAIARELALRASVLPDIPGPTRALALAECAVYTLLCDPSAAPLAIARARDAARAARPLDVSDVVAIVTAGDVLAFLAAANGESVDERFPIPGPFDAFVAERRGLVTLEFAGIAVGNARRGTGSAEAIATALDRYARGGPRFEARLARAYASRFVKSAKRMPPPTPSFDLTTRETEILTLLVEGLTNKEIAQRIVVSPRTVETHVERVLDKLEVGSRSRAIAKALRLGIVTLEPTNDP